MSDKNAAAEAHYKKMPCRTCGAINISEGHACSAPPQRKARELYVTEFKNQFDEWQPLHATNSKEKAYNDAGRSGRVLHVREVSPDTVQVPREVWQKVREALGEVRWLELTCTKLINDKPDRNWVIEQDFNQWSSIIKMKSALELMKGVEG